MSTSDTQHDDATPDLAGRFDQALEQVSQASRFAKALHTGKVLQLAGRLLCQPEGAEQLYQRATAIEHSGLFSGTDWANPEILQADITVQTLRLGAPDDITLEALSELRLLAVAQGELPHDALSAEQAHHYLAQVLALNLDLLFETGGEAIRVRQGRMAVAVRGVLQLLVSRIGYDNIIDRLIEEIWRILAQRPVRVDHLKAMITQIAACLYNPAITVSNSRGADRLVSALFGPTQASVEDPGLEVYAERLAGMDSQALQQEANGFARAMHDTGLVSAYQPVFLRFAVEQSTDLVSAALGLSATGRAGLTRARTLAPIVVRWLMVLALLLLLLLAVPAGPRAAG